MVKEQLTEAQKQADEAARIEKALEVSAKAGEALVVLFDESATTFRRARDIVKWLDKGADIKLIASSLSAARARKQYPDASEADLEFYATTKPGKGGVQVADSTIRAYSNAWASVEASGLVPTEETVNMAFKVMSKGRTSQPRKALEKKLAAAIEAGEIDQVAGAEVYVKTAREILTGRLAAEDSEGRPEGNSKKAPIVDLAEVADGIEGGTVPVSLEGALHTIRAILAQTWSDDEKVELASELHLGIEALMGEQVEV